METFRTTDSIDLRTYGLHCYLQTNFHFSRSALYTVVDEADVHDLIDLRRAWRGTGLQRVFMLPGASTGLSAHFTLISIPVIM